MPIYNISSYVKLNLSVGGFVGLSVGLMAICFHVSGLILTKFGVWVRVDTRMVVVKSVYVCACPQRMHSPKALNGSREAISRSIFTKFGK